MKQHEKFSSDLLCLIVSKWAPPWNVEILRLKFECLEQMRHGEILTYTKNISGFSYSHRYTTFIKSAETIWKKKFQTIHPTVYTQNYKKTGTW